MDWLPARARAVVVVAGAGPGTQRFTGEDGPEGGEEGEGEREREEGGEEERRGAGAELDLPRSGKSPRSSRRERRGEEAVVAAAGGAGAARAEGPARTRAPGPGRGEEGRGGEEEGADSEAGAATATARERRARASAARFWNHMLIDSSHVRGVMKVSWLMIGVGEMFAALRESGSIPYLAAALELCLIISKSPVRSRQRRCAYLLGGAPTLGALLPDAVLCKYQQTCSQESSPDR